MCELLTISFIRPGGSSKQLRKLVLSCAGRSESLGISAILVQTGLFSTALFGYLLLHFM